MQNTYVLVTFEDNEAAACGPFRANDGKKEEKWRWPLPVWPAVPPFYHVGQKRWGFKRSKLFYLWDHNGGVNNNNKKKKKENQQPSAKAEWAGKRSP